jgi:decaprenylphospho-beta-D-erythro-pentofuranosid-2-ulose 2-reductase
MMNSKIVVFGATSAIASETLRLLVQNELCLVGRSADRLEIVAQDLRVRGAKNVIVKVADIGDCNRAEGLVSEIQSEFGDFDVAIVAHGNLPDQEQAIATFEYARRAIEVNFLSVVALLTPIANYFEKRGAGKIAVISSVAGDRGRQSNYVYGSAKGATSLFLQGLRNRLAKANVQVLTVKPGFVDTPMTAHLPKGPLFAQPGAVAKGITRALEKGYDEVYLPWFWMPIMTAIRSIPEAIFKRMSL